MSKALQSPTGGSPVPPSLSHAEAAERPFPFVWDQIFMGQTGIQGKALTEQVLGTADVSPAQLRGGTHGNRCPQLRDVAVPRLFPGHGKLGSA